MKASIYLFFLCIASQTCAIQEDETLLLEIPTQINTRITTPLFTLPMQVESKISIPNPFPDARLQACTEKIETSINNVSNTIENQFEYLSQQLSLFPNNLKKSLSKVIVFFLAEFLGSYSCYKGSSLLFKGCEDYSKAVKKEEIESGKRQIKTGAVIAGTSLFFMFICIPELIDLFITN